jgi:FkbM family methyltransferase
VTVSVALPLVDGARVVVPDSLDLMTPYVLREQHDWFEDEIKFLRRLLQPGQRVIDIGANVGVYTLSMAHAVGAEGHVWAFEPATGTAALLLEGVAANGFAHVTLERSALSSRPGTARLALNPDCELNSIVHGAASGGDSEAVALVTLDDRRVACEWRDIEFVKIDAEGEEANILQGGKRFFAEQSPLVQYEIKAGAVVNLGLVRAFASLGYASFRLVPGLDLLVPFDPGSSVDGYQLNLFCCKPDRAARLARRGMLVERTDSVGEGAALAAGPYGWRKTLATLPYGAPLVAGWEHTTAAGRSGAVEEALALYGFSRDSSHGAPQRFAALQESLDRLEDLCQADPSHLRLASLARVARDYGARTIAVGALQELRDAILHRRHADGSEPFLAPGERFEQVPPGERFGDWALGAVLEELERIESYSSYYSGAANRPRLEMIRDLGFASPEMQRRLDLLEKRFGAATG